MSRLLWIALLAFSLSGCDVPDRIARTSSDTAGNKAIVRGYIENIINQGKWETYDQYMHPQIGFNDRRIDQMEFKRMIMSFKRAYPDITLSIQAQIAEGDRVVTRLVCRGTHLGTDQGVPATGRKVEYIGISIDRIKDGRIVEMWYLGDVWDRMQQIKGTQADTP